MTIQELECRLREVEQWAAKHDGKIDAYWESQHKWNPTFEKKVETLKKSQDSMKLSFAKLTAAMTATSALTGVGLKLLDLLG